MLNLFKNFSKMNKGRYNITSLKSKNKNAQVNFFSSIMFKPVIKEERDK